MGEKCLDYNNLQKNLFITTQLLSSNIEEIFPPFPLVKNPDSFLITFDVKFTTQVISKTVTLDKFKVIHDEILSLHNEGLGNTEISKHLNLHNIKTPTGINYTPKLIGMFFYKYRKMNKRFKHSELKLTNIRFFVKE
jgi:hypothetical protein